MCEFIPIELSDKGVLLPPKTELVALIDADTIAFSAASTCEVAIDLLPQSFYTDEEWNEIVSDPDYNDELHVQYSMDIDIALARTETKIKEILEATGCETFELHFSGGRENFRYEVKADYKGNRKFMHIPASLRELKEAMINKMGGELHTKWEADDVVVRAYYEQPEKYLVCAVDKDVIGSVPKAFNYYFKAAQTRKGKFYAEIPMKFVENTEASILRHAYKQCLMGDSNDGIGGIFGCGKVGAEKILNRAEQTHEGLWAEVLEAYEVAGMGEFDAIQTMQLVSMDQLVRDEEGNWIVKRWLPRFEISS